MAAVIRKIGQNYKMQQNCCICNLPIGISARNCVNIFAENSFLQSKKKLSEVISDIVETQVTDTPEQSSVVCKKCQKACTEYDSLKTRLQIIKNELSESYKRSVNSYQRANKSFEEVPKPAQKEVKKIVLPASKLQPLPANYVIEMGKLPGTSNIVFPKIESIGCVMPGGYLKMSNNLKVSVSMSSLSQSITKASPSSSPVKVSMANLVSSPSKLTNTISEKVIMTSLMMPTLNQNSIVTKQTKNPVMSFNVNLPKDFLSSSVNNKNEEYKNNESVKKEIVISNLGDETENNDEHAMEIDEDCSLAVVPVTTDENGKLVFEGDKIDLKAKTSANFFDVGLLLEGDSETRSSEREEKFILDKLQILNENLDDDDDDGEAIVMEEAGTGNGRTRFIRVGQQVLYDSTHIALVPASDDLDNEQHDSNDESQIELQVSGDEETANAIIAAAQEKGGAFIKVQSGEMYRVQSVTSRSGDHLPTIVQSVGEGKFKCLLCEKKEAGGNKSVVGDAEFIMYHLKNSHGARLYICQVCGHVMRRRSEYSAHIEEHAQKTKSSTAGGKPASRLHACGECGKTYNSRTLLAEHAHAHSGQRPYCCAQCGKAFASKYTLQAHLKTHEDRPRPFKCQSCGKAFLTQQNLNQHEKTHSGVKEFICEMCNKAFATQHNLEVHCVVHTGRKPFFCSVCDKAFARRAEVKDHMRIHTGERPFTCDICGATFTQRSNLHSHKRATHFDDKRYHCTHCPKRFKRRRLLDYHIKAAHTGERPLKCEICRATFVYPEHYKKHVRIHSGERPYVCEVCGKTFNSRDNRNMHRFVHSDKKPYECLACGAGYMRKQLLYAHMNATGHVAESIVVNQPKVITAVENIFEATSELELDENEVQTVEDDGTTKLFITEAGDKKIVIQDKSEINVVQDSDGSAFLTLHNLNGLIETNADDKLDDQAQIVTTDEKGNTMRLIQVQLPDGKSIVTTDEKGNTMRLIQVQLPDGKSGWVAINN